MGDPHPLSQEEKGNDKGRRYMKKIGLISLALVLALGALGVAYAAWTDQVTIEGTVETGKLELTVKKYSGTWAYKNLDTSEVIVHTGWANGLDPIDGPTGNLKLTGYAVAMPGEEPDEIVVEYEGLYPGIDWKVDWLLHYEGTVPAKLWHTHPVWSGPDASAFEAITYSIPGQDPDRIGYLYGEVWWSDADGGKGQNIGVSSDPAECEFTGLQVHYCDHILMQFTLGLYQHSYSQGLEASFTSTINAIQWNKYTPPGDPPEEPPEECYWEGETAMSAGHNYPKHPWFMYTPYDGEEKTVDLLAGSDLIKVGEVTFSDPVDGWVTITIDLLPDARFDPDSDLKISVKGYTNEDDAKAQGNFPFCTWPYKGEIPDWTMTSYSFDVPAKSASGAPYLFYALHADVEREICP